MSIAPILRLLPVWAAFAFLLVPLKAQVSSIRPASLRCEYRVNPLGIDVSQPRLSWILTAADPKARGVRQGAYRVLVASGEENLRAGKGDLWDTGKVASDQSAHVAYGGRPLRSAQRAYWRVQVWDQAGRSSGWSETALWSMGLLHSEDWKGKWIGLDEKETTSTEFRTLPARMLRKEFEVSGKLKRATAYICGLGLSELYINGAKVGDHVLSPGLTDYDKRVFYVTYDVTKQVAAGRNAVGRHPRQRPLLRAARQAFPLAMRTYGYPKAPPAAGTRVRGRLEGHRRERRDLEADHRRPDPRQQRIRRRGVRRPDGDAEAGRARLRRLGVAARRSWSPRPAGALVAQMAEPLRVTETLQPVEDHRAPARRLHLRHGPEHGRLVPPAASPGRRARRSRCATPRRCSTDGTLYVDNLRSAQGHRPLHAQGRRREV